MDIEMLKVFVKNEDYYYVYVVLVFKLCKFVVVIEECLKIFYFL